MSWIEPQKEKEEEGVKEISNANLGGAELTKGSPDAIGLNVLPTGAKNVSRLRLA